MSFFSKKKIVVTHNGTFHADDIFSAATLSILLDGKIKIIRTRDTEVISKADFVFDVGGEYDPSRNRFDHHQHGGAGSRENGIPYAAFGLVWKTYGEHVCGSKQIADILDEKLVQFIDANDNGVDVVGLKTVVAPYLIQDVFYSFRPSWKEGEVYDESFMKMVTLAREVLLREILKMNHALLAQSIIRDAYNKAEDKRVVILDGHYPWGETLGEYPEPLFVVFPKVGTWRVECIRKQRYSFENRKSLPEAWAGLRDEDLAQVTGVPDAIFCHNGRFLAVAKSKEGALLLAQKALLA